MRYVLIFLAFCLSAGCAGIPLEEAFSPDVKVATPVWPPSPEIPRVKLLRVIRGPHDVVPMRGAVRELVDYLVGDDQDYVEFVTPQGIAADGAGVIYVTDPGASVVHRLDLVRRSVSQIREAGTDTLVSPIGVAVDREGNLLVSDTVNAKVYRFSRSGKFLGLLGGSGTFRRPGGIAVSTEGEVIVVDVLAHNLKVFNGKGEFLREFPSKEDAQKLNTPSYVATGRDGLIYVTDSMNFRVLVFDREGRLVRTVGEIGDSPGSFARPKGVAVDSESHVYVVDATFDNFQIFDAEGALLLHVGESGGRDAQFALPNGIYIDRSDRIYVADTFNHRIQIFQYLKEGSRK